MAENRNPRATDEKALKAQPFYVPPEEPEARNPIRSLVGGAILCLFLGLLITSLLDLRFNGSWHIIANSLVAVLIAAALFVPGILNTKSASATIAAFFGTRRLKSYYLEEGPGWLMWFLGVFPYKGFVPQENVVTDAPGQVYISNQTLLDDREDKKVARTNGERLSIQSADNIETEIPLAGTYETFNPIRAVASLDPKTPLRAEVLEALRLFGTELRLNDLISLKGFIAPSVKGDIILLVAKIPREQSKDLAGLIYTKPNTDRIYRVLDSTATEKEIREAEDELVQEIIENSPAPDADGKRKGLLPDDFDWKYVDRIYVATKMLRAANKLGVRPDTIQTTDVTPVDERILQAAAKVEVELFEKRSEHIQAETRAAIAALLSEKFGLSPAEAARVARIEAGLASEININDTGSGKASPLVKAATIVTGSK